MYILVFGAGTGSEGLYSLQERTKDDVPVDIILAFPTHEDAARYGTLLEAEMGRVPAVEAARPEDPGTRAERAGTGARWPAEASC